MRDFSDVYIDDAWLEKARLEALQFAGIGLYRFRFDGVVIFMDAEARRIFELDEVYASEQEVAGKRLVELFQYLSPAGALRAEIREKKILRARPWSFTTLKGNIKHVIEDAYLIKDPRTEEECIQVVMRDISEQRRAERALAASERRFRETLESMHLAAVQLDMDANITFINDYLLNITGWSREDVLGFSYAELFLPPDIRDTLINEFVTMLEQCGEVPMRYENPILTRGGELRHFIWNNTLLRDENCEFIGLTCIGQDITDRRNAEQALRDSEAQYRTLVEMSPFAVSIFQDGKVVFVNETTRDIFRLRSANEFEGRDTLLAVAPEDRDRLRGYAERRLAGGDPPPSHYEARFTRRDGEVFPAEVYVRTMTYRNRPATLVLVIDITERKAAQDALKASEAKYRDILESIHDGYYEIDLDGNITFFNPALCKLLGYTPEEFRGMSYRDLYATEAAAKRARNAYTQVLRSGADMQLHNWPLLRKDGARAVFEMSIALMRDAKGEPVGFRGIARDVTERENAARALREAEARYRELFENANDIVYTHDLEGRFTSLNKAGERAGGYTREEFRNLKITDVVAPEFRALAAEMLGRKVSGHGITRYEAAIISKSGTRVPAEISTRLIVKDGKPVGVQGIARDITERQRAEEERRRLEAQMQHTQKLEGLGVLAGGIAHDFNNLLVGVLGNAGLALSRLPADSPARAYVEKIEATAQRAAELTNQMLAYAGKAAFVKRPLNLSTLAKEMGELLNASISKKAELHYDCPPDIPWVEGDSAQVHQVILNLVTNASDALGAEAGSIRVRTYTQAIGSDSRAQTCLNDPVPAGQYVCLEVSDTGCGMPLDTQSRIFDPFFSTKFTGRGLGLAAALGIVRGHQGSIAVESTPGEGTTFRVYFPVANGPVTTGHATGEGEPARDIMNWRTTGQILIADDEDTVRAVAEETLREVGFDTVSVNDGREAVRLFTESPDTFTAVLMDLMMPVMGGHQAIAEIRKVRPAIPVILSSGYAAEEAGAALKHDAFTAFIQKPYPPSGLVRLLRSMLEKPTP